MTEKRKTLYDLRMQEMNEAKKDFKVNQSLQMKESLEMEEIRKKLRDNQDALFK